MKPFALKKIALVLICGLCQLSASASAECLDPGFQKLRENMAGRLRAAQIRAQIDADQLEAQTSLRTEARLRSSAATVLGAAAVAVATPVIDTLALVSLEMGTTLTTADAVGTGLFATGVFGASQLSLLAANFGLERDLERASAVSGDPRAFEETLHQLERAREKVIDLTDAKSLGYSKSNLTLGWNVSSYLTVQVEKYRALKKLDDKTLELTRAVLDSIDFVCAANLADRRISDDAPARNHTIVRAKRVIPGLAIQPRGQTGISGASGALLQ